MATATEAVIETPAELKTCRYLLSALTADGEGALKELAEITAHAGCVLESSEDLGLKKLSFPVAKKTELNLVSIFFTANREQLKAFEAELLHSENIARYLITTWNAGLDEQGNQRPKRKQKKDV